MPKLHTKIQSCANANREHVWGSYRELNLCDDLIVRSIRLYEDAYNSVHSHATTEVMLVESGEMTCYLGEDPKNLTTTHMKPGDVCVIPANHWHKIEYVNGEFNEDGVKFVQIVETMLGDHQNGTYEIKRFASAKEGKLPSTHTQELVV